MGKHAIIVAIIVQTLLANQAIIDLPANTWYEIPNSQLMHAMYRPSTTGMIGAWSGGVYDPIARRMLVWGGGLGNYPFNEILAFSVDSLKWTRLTEPCLSYGCCDPDPCGTPMIRHSYAGMAFITHANRMFLNGGAKNCGISQPCPNSRTMDGVALKKTWTFDVASNTWELMYKFEDILDTVLQTEGDGPQGTGSTCSYDTLTRKVFFASAEDISTYDFDKNLWTKICNANSYYQASTVDTKRKRFIVLGNNQKNSNIDVMDLSIPAYPLTKQRTYGDTSILALPQIGMDYDPVADKYVCWRDSSVFSLDPDTWEWTKHEAANAPVPTLKGIYGRWRYIPHLNAFACITKEDQNVSFYKFTSGAPTNASNYSSNNPGKQMLTLSPNPFTTSTKIVATGMTNMNKCTIKFYNVSGVLVHNADVSVQNGIANYTWDTSRYPVGLYVVKTGQNNRQLHAVVMRLR